jgi:hypothetical protein
MTNVTAGAYADMPLFLFHLLEYLDLDYKIDVDDINERWSRESAVDVWSQIVLKETSPTVDCSPPRRDQACTGWPRTEPLTSCGQPGTGTGFTASPRPATRDAGGPAAVARPDQGVVQAGLSAIRGRG